MKTVEEHLEKIRSLQSASAAKAIDYLDGDQKIHFEEYLDTDGQGIKHWRTRGVLPLWENITGLIIDRSAQTYQNQPERIVLNKAGDVDEVATQKYNELIEDSNLEETLEDADLQARLLNTSVVISQFSNDRDGLYFSAMSQHNADASFNRETRTFNSLLYSGGGIGPKGNQLYHYWDNESIKDLEVGLTGGVTSSSMAQDNPYGMVPAAVLFDIRPPRVGLWGKPKWEQLINFNNGINLFHTEMKFNQRFQSFGMLVTNMDIPSGQIAGPDVVMKVKASHPDEAVFFEYKAPSSISVAIKSFTDWLDSFRENIGQEWGVNIKVAGEGYADSGFKLVVEELPGLQLRKKRQKPADTFEQDLYRSVLAISRVHNLGLPEDSRLTVKFPEPDLPVNLKEKAEVEQMELAANIITLEELWLKRDPTLTPEELAEKRAKITVNTPAIPDFGGLFNA